MMHRKRACDVCKCELKKSKTTTQEWIDGSQDTIYVENCAKCDCLLYGWTKKTRDAELELVGGTWQEIEN